MGKHYFKKCKTGERYFFGYGKGHDKGSITARLSGCGKATLDFGNCYEQIGNTIDYNVDVFLNKEKIDAASGFDLSRKITFDFGDGDKLKLEEDGAIILFNSFIIRDCKKCPSQYVPN